MGRRSIIGQLPKAKQDALIADVLQGRSYADVGKECGCSDMSVQRWWHSVSEEDKRRVAAKVRADEAKKNTAILNEDRLDIARTYESLAKRVEKLITQAEEEGDGGFALAAMEGLRKVLRDIAQMQGKLAQNLTVEVKLAESAEWVALRHILQAVCDEVPEAREPLLRHMRKARLSITQEDGDAL